MFLRYRNSSSHGIEKLRLQDINKRSHGNIKLTVNEFDVFFLLREVRFHKDKTINREDVNKLVTLTAAGKTWLVIKSNEDRNERKDKTNSL